ASTTRRASRALTALSSARKSHRRAGRVVRGASMESWRILAWRAGTPLGAPALLRSTFLARDAPPHPFELSARSGARLGLRGLRLCRAPARARPRGGAPGARGLRALPWPAAGDRLAPGLRHGAGGAPAARRAALRPGRDLRRRRGARLLPAGGAAR